MNKKSIITIFIVITFIVCCSIIFKKYTNNYKIKNNDSENSFNEENINENNQEENFDYNNIQSIYELPIPDKIIYYYNNGDKIEIGKDMKEFSEIINLHRQSYTNNGEISMNKLYVGFENINSMIKSEKMLVYDYGEKGDIYFTLRGKNEEGNLIMPKYLDSRFNYGAIMSNTTLVDYLNKLI